MSTSVAANNERMRSIVSHVTLLFPSVDWNNKAQRMSLYNPNMAGIVTNVTMLAVMPMTFQAMTMSVSTKHTQKSVSQSQSSNRGMPA